VGGHARGRVAGDRDAECAAVLGLRERGEIDDECWRRVERDLDLEELRMDS
jgi:hypothetical protein